MDKLVAAVKPFFKRYDLVIIFSLMTLVYCIIEYFIFFPLVLGMSVLKSGSVLEIVIYIIQLAFKYLFKVKYLIYVIIGIAACGILFGLIFSAVFYSLNNFLSKKARPKDGVFKAEFLKSQYLTGIKQHFLKMSLMSASTILYSILFIGFMTVVTVPAIAVLRGQIEGKIDFLPLAIVLTVITAVVLFFGFMFFRTYILFWYPATFNFKRKTFAIGKRAADTFFWEIVSFLVVFDVAFCSFQLLLILLNSLMAGGQGVGFLRFLILILLNWVVKTVLFTILIVFVFSKFQQFKKRIITKTT
ncbi:MAG TPA: hypothetical protein DCE02_01165 [Ruminiclostridium sp.]|jgi:hypothetical protein|uniref:Membrane domain of glycerophosphoryl diester phosphodiesterase n=1 Tax=Acetivibrio saccincola TaxID=1677857 RepID=A0A2K9E1S5_9FIRM|nr:hypothetical protein [Acetivibrio saccincola]AUG56328.1 hypothetical protein HVS_01825 [Acetivibrio saccincola]NLW27944.1 hypothetical protein [Acetivibrio saccincola]PQQ65472.1 hypothetical protein B9R14_00955 [Acetivibrio saccincola]HAA42604.1 hypothetical protein [Ruminiclostridium sp.]